MGNTLNQSVELQWYKQEFFKQLRNFELPEEKAQFTAFPVDLLEGLVDGQYPIVILNKNEPVGFSCYTQPTE